MFFPVFAISKEIKFIIIIAHKKNLLELLAHFKFCPKNSKVVKFINSTTSLLCSKCDSKEPHLITYLVKY